MVTSIGELVDRIREQPLEPLLETLGWKRRGRVWHCAFHEDKTPSASVKKNRVRCFACGESWSAVDVVIKATNQDFIGALKWLCDFHGVPFPDRRLTPAERKEQAELGRRAKCLAIEIEDWFSVVRIAAQQQAWQLSSVAAWAWAHEYDNLADTLDTEARRLRRLLNLEPVDIARGYAAARLHNRSACAWVTAAGRRDREHAESITRAVLDLITGTQEEPGKWVS